MAQTELARIDGGVGENKLTPSEAEIVEMVCAGATNREIASTLHLSVKAVEGSLTRLFRRLRVRNRAELVHTFEGTPEAPLLIAADRIVRGDQKRGGGMDVPRGRA